jgi:hypothetical protein
MKKAILIFFLTLLLTLILSILLNSCVTPYRIIETYTTDSLGRTVKTVQKIYQDGSSVPVQTVIYSDPYYLYPYAVPRVILPLRPVITRPVVVPRFRH